MTWYRVASIGVLACFAALAVLAFAGCEQRGGQSTHAPKKGDAPASSRAPDANAPLAIYTTFYPSRYFAQRVAGDLATVTCPVPDDADPIFWQPSREQIGDYQKADLILVNGGEYEKWIATASLPESRVVDLSRSFADAFIRYESVTHQHGSGGAHTHEGIDGHTWLDPINAKAQVQAIAKALRQRRPDHVAAIDQRTAELERDLDVLDARFKALAPAARDVLLIASHPAYNYPSRRYALGIVNVALDPEAEPSAGELAAIDRATGKRPEAKKRILLWESQPIDAAVKAVASRVDEHVVFSPIEVLDPEANIDYLARMNKNLDALERALAPSAK